MKAIQWSRQWLVIAEVLLRDRKGLFPDPSYSRRQHNLWERIALPGTNAILFKSLLAFAQACRLSPRLEG